MNSSSKYAAVLKKVVLVVLIGVLMAVEGGTSPALRIEQAEAQTGTPNPHIDHIYIDGSSASTVTIAQGESLIVRVQATNVGTAAAERGAIYISFPEFDSHASANYVGYRDGSANVLYHEYRPGDSAEPIMYHCGSSYRGPAQVLLVEAKYDYSSSHWEAGESIFVEVQVAPPGPGTYQIYARAYARGSEEDYYFDPATAPYSDQQCQYAHRRVVEVERGPYAAYLPLVSKQSRMVLPEVLHGVRMQASSCYITTRCDARLDCFKAADINVLYYDIYYQYGSKPACRYHSDLMPHREFDALAYLVPRAHAQGMEVYALIPSGWMGWREHQEWNARLNHPGVPEDWLDFALPEARLFLADVAEEIVTNYDVDGILLDATRWREPWYRRLGLSADDVSLAVEGIYERVKSVRPDVLVAASPHADYRFSLNERGQDWHGWLRDGYMDYVTPLTYGDDNWVRKYLGQWQETDYFPGRIVPRLSVCSFNPTTPKPTSSVLRQIQIGSDAGATGTTLWDDRYICQNSSLVRALGAGGW